VSVSSSRRSLLKKGIFGGALLVVAGSVPVFLRPTGRLRTPPPGRVLVHLTPVEYGIFAAAAARLVLGDGATADWPTTDQVDCAGTLDDVLGTMHPRTAAEVCQLLRLFENAMTGLVATGRPQTFTAAAPAEQDRRLESWRHSRLAVLRSGYEALKRLAHATYYASPAVYAAVGYPGPPTISRPAGVEDPAAAVPR
jgi:hypothetical protein